MQNMIKIAVLGGDMRQISAAKVLAENGYSVSLWGIDEVFCKMLGQTPCNNLNLALSGCRVLLLPLPVTEDGAHLFCPLGSEGHRIHLLEILEALPQDAFVLGGRINPNIKQLLTEKGLRHADFLSNEEFQIKNALPTAEGALAIAMNELPITIAGAKTAVIGYGRIGKILASKLKALDAEVTVAARKSADLATIECNGLSPLFLQINGCQNTLKALTKGYDVIFNTVPVRVIDESVIKELSPSTLIIDLASAPGGIDRNLAQKCGIKVIWALSLPGKNSPITAGKIIAQTVSEILETGGHNL